NIMLGSFDETLVMDWGLARSVKSGTEAEAGDGVANREDSPFGDSGDQTKGVIGTPGFMSPEQQAGQWDRAGPASDIFSLGGTPYVLLTNRVPFQRGAPTETAGQVARSEFLAPHVAETAIPRALEAVCLKALALRPEGRYGSAQELADEIERWLAN